jgi:hypothetical protein
MAIFSLRSAVIDSKEIGLEGFFERSAKSTMNTTPLEPIRANSNGSRHERSVGKTRGNRFSLASRFASEGASQTSEPLTGREFIYLIVPR